MAAPLGRRAFLSFGSAHEPAALLRPPWANSARAFEHACYGCGQCLAACPAGIQLADAAGRTTLDFSRTGCSFCGACVTACPREAFEDLSVPPWQPQAEIGTDCLSLQGVTCRVCGEHCDARTISFRPSVGVVVRPEVTSA